MPDADRSFGVVGHIGLGLFFVEGGKRGGELAPACDAQAWIDPEQMGPDGAVGDEQALADLPVAGKRAVIRSAPPIPWASHQPKSVVCRQLYPAAILRTATTR